MYKKILIAISICFFVFGIYSYYGILNKIQYPSKKVISIMGTIAHKNKMQLVDGSDFIIKGQVKKNYLLSGVIQASKLRMLVIYYKQILL